MDQIRGWELPGPNMLTMDIADLKKMLGLSEDTIKRMIQRGEFPTGMLISNQLTWTGADIAAYLHLRGRFNLAANDAKPGKTVANDSESNANERK